MKPDEFVDASLQNIVSRGVRIAGTSVLHAMDSFWKEWAHFFLGPLPASFTSLSPAVVTRKGITVKEKVHLLLLEPQDVLQTSYRRRV